LQVFSSLLILISICNFSFFSILGFELRALHLLIRLSLFEAYPYPFFLFIYFSGRILHFFPEQALYFSPPTYSLLLSRMTGTWHHAQLLVEMGFHKHFSWTGIDLVILIPASWLSGIIGMSHHASPLAYLSIFSM
jgi:hypothetical protein